MEYIVHLCSGKKLRSYQGGTRARGFKILHPSRWTMLSLGRCLLITNISYAIITIIEPPLQICRLLDFCWTQIPTFRPGFFADQCTFTVVWSPYFYFKISGPQTIAVAREQFWPHLCKMLHQCHTRQLCRIEAPTDTIEPEFYWRVRRSPNSHRALWPHAFWLTSSIRICLLITAPFLLKFGF